MTWNFSSNHISYNTEITPCFFESDICYICSKFLEWAISRFSKFSCKNILLYYVFLSCFQTLFIWIFSPNFCEEIILFHQSEYFLMVHSDSFLSEFHTHHSVTSFSLYAIFLNFFSIFFLSLLFRAARKYTFFMFVIPRNTQSCYMTEYLCIMMLGKLKDNRKICRFREIFRVWIHTALSNRLPQLEDIHFVLLNSFLKYLFFLSCFVISSLRIIGLIVLWKVFSNAVSIVREVDSLLYTREIQIL